jgi:segregation and condensation protein B
MTADSTPDADADEPRAAEPPDAETGGGEPVVWAADEAAPDDEVLDVAAAENPPLDDESLPGALEAILMVVDEPVGDVVLAQVLQRTRGDVRNALERLSAEYTTQRRGFDLRLVAGGWRFYTRPEHAPVVERFVLDGQQARLTQAALETLAVVAYRQPVSRSRVSAIRGVNVDGVIRTLLSRGLVEECGTEADSGAILYRTTSYFLERLGIAGTGELPEIHEYLPEIDPLDDESLLGST